MSCKHESFHKIPLSWALLPNFAPKKGTSKLSQQIWRANEKLWWGRMSELLSLLISITGTIRFQPLIWSMIVLHPSLKLNLKIIQYSENYIFPNQNFTEVCELYELHGHTVCLKETLQGSSEERGKLYKNWTFGNIFLIRKAEEAIGRTLARTFTCI